MLASSKRTAPVTKGFGAHEIIEATIAINKSITGEINIAGYRYIAIIMPDAWTTADLTFTAAELSGATFKDLYGGDGVEVLIYAGTARVISIDIADSALAPLPHIKIRSGTTGTPVNQSAERTLKILLQG